MSTVLVSRLTKLTLQQSRPSRWIAPSTIPITSYLLSSRAKKASTAAANPAPATNNNNDNAPSLPVSDNVGSNNAEKSTSNQNSPNNANGSNSAENPTKGRKITRKSRRSIQVIPSKSISFFEW